MPYSRVTPCFGRLNEVNSLMWVHLPTAPNISLGTKLLFTEGGGVLRSIGFTSSSWEMGTPPTRCCGVVAQSSLLSADEIVRRRRRFDSTMSAHLSEPCGSRVYGYLAPKARVRGRPSQSELCFLATNSIISSLDGGDASTRSRESVSWIQTLNQGPRSWDLDLVRHGC